MTTKTEKKKSEYATGWGDEEKPLVGEDETLHGAGGGAADALANAKAAAADAWLESERKEPPATDPLSDEQKIYGAVKAAQVAAANQSKNAVKSTQASQAEQVKVAWQAAQQSSKAAANLDPHGVMPQTLQSVAAPAPAPPPTPMPDLPHESPPMPTLAKVGILVFLSGLGYVIYDFLKGKK